MAEDDSTPIYTLPASFAGPDGLERVPDRLWLNLNSALLDREYVRADLHAETARQRDRLLETAKFALPWLEWIEEHYGGDFESDDAVAKVRAAIAECEGTS